MCVCVRERERLCMSLCLNPQLGELCFAAARLQGPQSSLVPTWLGLPLKAMTPKRQKGMESCARIRAFTASTLKAFFTETPHDMTARAGEDVEMACSFRGSGSPSYSLEIQWWYVRTHKDWTDKQSWASNQLKASPQEETGKEATKISVVKVVGSNISHKLRLSRVKPTDEGTYECRVIDFSDSKARHHKVKAYLRVEAEENAVPHRHSAHGGHLQDTQQQLLGAQTSDHSKLSAPHPQHQHHHKPGKELKKRSVADDASCTL